MQNDTSPFISAIERCPIIAQNTWSVYPFKPECQSSFENSVREALSQVAGDNPYLKVSEGEVSAIEAIRHNPGSYGLDIRPKVYDNKSKSWTLLDSGSCVSTTPKQPGDVIDPNFKLRAVNGGSIATFGTEVITIRIGRKQYDIEAVKVDIPQKILGWDFFKKHSLGFEWGRYGDLFLTDKKAKIKSILKCFRLPTNSVQSVEVDWYEEPLIQTPSSQQTYFEVNCMKSLGQADITMADINAMSIAPDQSSPLCDDLPLETDEDPDMGEQNNLKALESVPEQYRNLIQKYPEMLKTKFKKEPADIYHRIETDGSAFKSKVRPLLANSDKFQEGKKIWKEMEKVGVIERVKQSSLLQYTSPLHLVRKPSGRGWRVCADFRKLNQVTKSDNYPLPLLRSFQSNIKGAKLFSKLDIQSAFHHLPIHPDDVNKTCVLSPWGGAFVFKRLCFGLSNGPASWQKYVDAILSDIPGLFCYLDDILLCSDNVDQHMSTLETIFQRLSSHGLTLAVDKCEFGQSTVEYLGYQVSSTGIRPLKRKIDAIERIPSPKTQKSLLHFLGALNYFRTSLSGLVKNGKYHNTANLLQPLYSAATVPMKANKFEEVWDSSPVLKQAFVDAKTLLIKAAELSHPDPKLPLALMCDASDHSIGSVLLQQGKNGVWTPLGYMSKHLSIDKTRWSTCRKELLAAQAGLRYFINEIYGRHCTIYSDHAPLVLAFKNPQGFQLHDPVAQRALMEIGQFTKDIRHIAGHKNVGSDYLSRIPPEARGTEYEERLLSTKASFVSAIEGHKLEAVSPAVIFEEQQSCEEIKDIKAGKCPANTAFQEVKFGDYNLYCEVSGAQPRPYLPSSLRLFVMKQLHFDHKGQKEAVLRMSSHYYWKQIRVDTINFVKTCHGCQSTKPSKLKPPHIGEFDTPDSRFQHIHLDIVGPLPPSRGYRYILTLKDRSTRFVQGVPLVSPTSESIAEAFMLHWTALFGIPSIVTSDQGPNLTSELFRGLQDQLGIQVDYSPIYYPQANGLIERSHQSLKNSIKASLIEMGDKYQEKWVQYLPWALLGLRSSFNKDLGTSPMEMTTGKHAQLPGTILADPDEVFTNEDINLGAILRKLQIKNNVVAVPPSVNVANPKVQTLSDSVSHVYVKQHNTKGLSHKYLGPLPVTSRPNRSTIEVKVGLNRHGAERLEIRHMSDIKVAHLRENATIAERPKRGRPVKQPEDTILSPPQSTAQAATPSTISSETSETVTNPNAGNSNSTSTSPPAAESTRPVRATRNQSPNYIDSLVASIDFSKPPPSRHWTASSAELEEINRSINTRKYSVEGS